MASNYSKLDLKSFKERLTAKHYKDATGARRGVGKSEMSADDKSAAYTAINRHFGVEAKPAKAVGAPKAKRAPAKRAATVKSAAKVARGAGRAKRTTTAKKGTSARGRKAADAEGAPAARELADLQAGTAATQSAMAGLAAAAELDPKLDVRAAAQHGAEILQHSIERIGKILGHKTAEPTAPASAPPPDAEEEPSA